MTSSSGEDPSAALVALGGVCRQRLCPGRSLHTHTRMHAHPGAWQGSRMCLGRVSCPLELCRKDRDTLRSLRVPLHLKGSSPSASAARSAFLAALPRAGPAPGFPLHPVRLRRCGKSPPAPSLPLPDRTPPSHPPDTGRPCCSNTAAFNTHFLLPLVLSLGHSRLLLLGPA